MPYVVHYYVTKESRSLDVARACLKRFKEYFKRRGLKYIILNVKSEDTRIQKAVEYLFRVKAYKEEDRLKFYMVEVSHG